jgi:hypothetical protein
MFVGTSENQGGPYVHADTPITFLGEEGMKGRIFSTGSNQIAPKEFRAMEGLMSRIGRLDTRQVA